MKYADFEHVTTSELTLPATPARWIVKEPSYTTVLEITVTCGGVVGGSQWKEIVHVNPETIMVGKMEMLECIRWDGKKIILNPRYIVKIEGFILVEATCESRNHYCPGNLTTRVLMEDGCKVKLVDKF